MSQYTDGPRNYIQWGSEPIKPNTIILNVRHPICAGGQLWPVASSNLMARCSIQSQDMLKPSIDKLDQGEGYSGYVGGFT